MQRTACAPDFAKLTAAAIVAAVVVFGGADSQRGSALSSKTGSHTRIATSAHSSAERTKDFIRAVLGDTEDVWDELFRERAYGIYPRPTIVLVSRWASSACGRVDVSLAPYYCVRDTRIYVDPTLLNELANRSGDFAAAYVIAREVGLHVQAVLRATRQLDTGTLPAMQRPSTQTQPSMVMQADCYAGVWTYSVRKRNHVEASEVEDGSAAAVNIGSVSNDADYAARRLRAFRHGLSTGDPRNCDPSAMPG